MVDASVRARTLGIATSYKDLRGGRVRFLPQRLAVIAQGATAAAGYSTTKFTAESAKQVGTISGFRGPAYAILDELMPANGDGVGPVPIDVLLLADGTTASTGAILPSGTPASTATWYARIGGVLSKGFEIPSGAVNLTRDLKSMGQAIQAVTKMPMTVGWTYDTLAQAFSGTGNGTLTELAASTTTCIPGDWVLVCIEEATDAGTFRLTDPDGTIISETIVASAAGAVFDEGGLTGKLTDGTTDFALGDTFTITVPALTMPLTSAWKGASANNIEIEILNSKLEAIIDNGSLAFTLTQPTSGAGNPTVDAALAQIGDCWNTMVINALNWDDTTALDAFSTWGEGRWGELVHKPAVVFVGNPTASPTGVITTTSTRTTDRVNCQLTAPGSPNMPHVVAAREVARIVRKANQNPPHDYQLQKATGLVPGLDSEQWSVTQRDAILKGGSSTAELRNGVVCVSDVVTPYAPDGDDLPAYRWVVDIVRLQNVIYNVNALFDSENWAGKILIPDGQVSENPDARHPSDAVAALSALADNLCSQAICSDPDTMKASITAAINSQNNRRLDVGMTAILSSNAGVISVDLKFGFFFG